MWRDELGVQIELRQIERKIFYSAQSRLEYDMSTSSWIGDYNDANTFLDCFLSNSGNNRTGWKNARYDELVHEANRQTDPKRRAALFQQAETILVTDEAPIVPVYFYAGINYFDSNKIYGIWQNVLDEHPMQFIGKKSRGSKVEGREAKLR
jgi:oligopeptide transport system substrate-binding protein